MYAGGDSRRFTTNPGSPAFALDRSQSRYTIVNRRSLILTIVRLLPPRHKGNPDHCGQRPQHGHSIGCASRDKASRSASPSRKLLCRLYGQY
jgi:hypothetical protein